MSPLVAPKALGAALDEAEKEALEEKAPMTGLIPDQGPAKPIPADDLDNTRAPSQSHDALPTKVSSDDAGMAVPETAAEHAKNLQCGEPGAQNLTPAPQNLPCGEPGAQNLTPAPQNLWSQENLTPEPQNPPPRENLTPGPRQVEHPAQHLCEGQPKGSEHAVQVPAKLVSKGKGVGKLCSKPKQGVEVGELNPDEPPSLPPRQPRQMHASEPAAEKPPVSHEPNDEVLREPPKKLTQAAISRRMYRIMQPKSNGEYKVSEECLATYKNMETRPKLLAVFEKVGYNADRFSEKTIMLTHASVACSSQDPTAGLLKLQSLVILEGIVHQEGQAPRAARARENFPDGL